MRERLLHCCEQTLPAFQEQWSLRRTFREPGGESMVEEMVQLLQTHLMIAIAAVRERIGLAPQAFLERKIEKRSPGLMRYGCGFECGVRHQHPQLRIVALFHFSLYQSRKFVRHHAPTRFG